MPYWKDYQSCAELFGERMGVLPYKQSSPDRQLLLKQAVGCLASEWAKLAAEVGEGKATKLLKLYWGAPLPMKVIEAGLQRKPSFAHIV
ncbi:hypothetical protein ACFLYF_01310 [Chloroflexota bacterium]